MASSENTGTKPSPTDTSLYMSWVTFSTNCKSFFFPPRPKLKEHMRYCDQHPEEIDKLAKVKAQVTEVKGVMMQNIEKVDLSFFYNGYQLLILWGLMKL
jgi:hypothetical protein